MSNAVAERRIDTMSEVTIANVRRLEAFVGQLPQTLIPTSHLIHAGMYSRTIMVPAGVTIVGSLMKIPTLLILSGDFVIYIDNEPIELHGYNVFSGNANRKQAGYAIGDTYVTMVFPTSAKTVEEAEEEFTDETHLLFSRNEDAINHVTITGK
jgi:hypothetical protein